MARKAWPVGTMQDGIRKRLNRRESKKQGESVCSWNVPYTDANGSGGFSAP
jgi:hypothetical protein